MRIIAGEFKGRVLKAPKGSATRPTTDRVREALFSALSSACGGLEGAVVLDAFAGSGALSFEALSRGARLVWMYERDRNALQALSDNIKALELSAKSVRLQRRDIFKAPPFQARPPFGVVLLDPPYAYSPHEVLGLVERLRLEHALEPDAVVVYEHSADANAEVDLAAQERGFTSVSRKKYGDTVVDMLSVGQSGTGD